jgi:putative membrane protein
MTTSQSNLAGLSRFVFRTPSWRTSLAFALLLAALTGVAAFESENVASWRGLLFLGRDAWEGIFFIGVPTVVATFATANIDRALGGQLSRNHSSLLALVCEVIVVAILTAAAVIAILTPLGQWFVLDALVVGLASIFALRLLVIMAVSRLSLPIAAIPASIQTATSAVLLFIYAGTLRFLEVGGPLLEAYLMPYLARPGRGPEELVLFQPENFILLGILCALYAVAVYVFLIVVDRPWRQSLGVSVLDFFQGFVGHVAEGSRELEDFFEQIGEKAMVPVTVLSFRRIEDDPKDAVTDGGATALGAEKARFVLPMVHPGPMGEIGGGNLPVRIANDVDGLAFPPHATAGHDFNLVTEREVETLVDAADRAAERIEYESTASASIRETTGDASMLGQRFGDGAILVNTFSPTFADDVEYGVGLTAATEARTSGLEEILLVDAHNCNNGLEGPDLGHVTPGSRRSFDLIDAARAAGEELSETADGRLRLGVAWDRTRWDPEDGIGPLGIRVAVMGVETSSGEEGPEQTTPSGGGVPDEQTTPSGGEVPDEQTTAYILIDGNNMEPGLRDRLVERLMTGEGTTVDEVEVMTTDTHIVNTVDADNQVGAAIDHDELLALVQGLVDDALADRGAVAAGLASENVEVTVFGNDRTETLASHANAAVAMGGALAAAVTLAVMAVSVLIFFLA